MNKLYVIILSITVFLLSGCAQTSINDNNLKAFEFGNKNNYINKVTYINKDKSIIFYIDSKEYSEKFNLCNKKESYCDSYFEIIKTDDKTNPYKISFKFIFSDGITHINTVNNLNEGINNIEKDAVFKVE